MACYCQHCRFVYSTGTTNCFSCGRLTSVDDLPFQHYLDNGYRPIGNIAANEAASVQGSEMPVFTDGFTAGQPDFSQRPLSSAGGSTAEAVSILEGEDVPYTTGQSRTDENSSNRIFSPTELVNQEMGRLQQLQDEQERQRRELNRRIRRHNRFARLTALPWHYVFRFFLILVLIILLIVIWNMRYTIFNGIISIIVSLLPLILIIYLFISLFRGHF